MKRNNRLRHSLFIWHRYIGISTAAVIIMLSLTGLLLNHTEKFKLDEKRVQSDLILNWYGVKLSKPTSSFKLNTHWLTQVEEQIYLDSHLLPLKNSSPILGSVETKSFIAIGFRHEIFLTTKGGELIEQIKSTEGLPKEIQNLGLNELEQPIIKTPNGLFVSEDGLLSWQKYPSQYSAWSVKSPLPAELSEHIAHSVRKNAIPLERFILDLHSGRLFGSLGVLFIDVATLLFIFLAFSGFWLWLRQRRYHKRK